MKALKIIYNKLVYRPYLNKKLKQVGSSFKFGHSSELINPQYFDIGNNVFVGPYAYFVTNKNHQVQIGNNVMFGPFCKIIGGNHNTNFIKNHMIFNTDISHEKSEIIIEDGCWVGAEVTTLSKAFLAEGSIIGAKSLVNKYVPPYCIGLGIPINKIYPRFKKPEDLKELLKNVNSKYTFEEINSIYSKYNIDYK